MQLKTMKASWSKQDIQSVLDLNHRLQTWQRQADAPEALATLPVLSLNEVSPMPEQFATEYTKIGNAPLLYHKVSDSGVVHFNLYFSLADCPLERLGDISFMTNLLGILPTKQHTVAKLQQEIKRNFGFLDYNIAAYAISDHSERCKPYFAVSASVLKNKLAEAVKLMIEILDETMFDGEQSASLIHEILMRVTMVFVRIS